MIVSFQLGPTQRWLRLRTHCARPATLSHANMPRNDIINNNNSLKKGSARPSISGGKNIPTPDKKKQQKVTASKTKVDINYSKCPCGNHDENSWKMKCTRCPQEWHSRCVNLKGIKEEFVVQLEDWLCPLCFTAPGVTQRQNQQLESLQLSIASLSDKNIDLEQTINRMDEKFSSLLSDTDEIRELSKLTSGKLVKLDDIEVHIQHRTLQDGQIDEKLRSMRSQLSELQTSIDELKNTQPPPFQPTPGPDPPPTPSPPILDRLPTPDGILPATYNEEFIDATVVESVTNFLSSEGKFNDENGHSVQLFGHPYSYTGSRAASKAVEKPVIPKPLEPIFEKVNRMQAEQFFTEYPELKGKVDPPVINSCLVNRYAGEESFLPEHSDNETTINPESSIYTISIGANCQVTFADKYSNSDVHTLDCNTGSLYAMTRRSQEFFTHRIERGGVGGLRYSLTFRAVNWRNRNATLIIGDSNTCNLAFGSNLKNSFGELMPGQQVYTPTLDHVDKAAVRCCGYKNVVFSCGINDLKPDNVKTQADIDTIFQRYCSTISNIRRLNSKTNLFIVPILPTKSHQYNWKALYFNSRIFRDLGKLGLGVIHVDGVQNLLDSNDLLSERLSRQFDRHNRLDLLHLNDIGVKIFARVIKKSVFSRLLSGTKKRNGTGTPIQRRASSPQNAVGLGVGATQDGCQV